MENQNSNNSRNNSSSSKSMSQGSKSASSKRGTSQDDSSEMDSRSTDSQSRGMSSGRQGSSSMETQSSSSENKSVGAVIAQSLAKESQESIDQALGQVQTAFKSTTDYVSENTREALLIAAAAGLSAYVLLATKPGRKVFDAGAERFIPEVTKWISTTFSSRTQDVH